MGTTALVQPASAVALAEATLGIVQKTVRVLQAISAGIEAFLAWFFR